MPKEEWGVKRACPKCSVRFYDLQNDPMTCPSCGATFDVASLTQQKTRSSTPSETAKVAEPKVADDLEDTAASIDDDDNTDDLGDDVLDEDDDDTVNLEEIADMPNESDEN